MSYRGRCRKRRKRRQRWQGRHRKEQTRSPEQISQGQSSGRSLPPKFFLSQKSLTLSSQSAESTDSWRTVSPQTTESELLLQSALLPSWSTLLPKSSSWRATSLRLTVSRESPQDTCYWPSEETTYAFIHPGTRYPHQGYHCRRRKVSFHPWLHHEQGSPATREEITVFYLRTLARVKLLVIFCCLLGGLAVGLDHYEYKLIV